MMEATMRRWTGPTPVLLTAAVLLAVQPLAWLVGTWRDPAYNVHGLLPALAAAALALWSYSSEQQPGSAQNRRYAFVLLAASAAVRLAGQLLRVNVVSALTLAIDVYALATLAGLRQRQRAVSPLWLSVLFAFSLPVERVVQRLAGYALQQLSAEGACAVVGWFSDGVRCAGTRIVLEGQDLLVDLPCSGARGLTLVLMLFAGLCAVKRPSAVQAAAGLLCALAGALFANAVRIAALALGLAYAPQLDLMDGLAHETLGLLALVLAALPVALWAVRLPPKLFVGRENAGAASRIPLNEANPAAIRTHRSCGIAGAAAPHPAEYASLLPPCNARALPTSRGLAWLLLGFAIVAISVPAQPVDVARAVAKPAPPAWIGGFAAQPRALDAVERAYFARYGGGAAKAGYGPYGLLLVSTAAPLRHLHAPDECLRGSGYHVRYEGLEHGALPTALYRATDADGRSWRVAVSYVSDRGDTAASVAEAVWRWLHAPGSTWTMVQRLAPLDADAAERARWDGALMRALDLPSAAPQTFFRVAHTET